MLETRSSTKSVRTQRQYSDRSADRFCLSCSCKPPTIVSIELLSQKIDSENGDTVFFSQWARDWQNAHSWTKEFMYHLARVPSGNTFDWNKHRLSTLKIAGLDVMQIRVLDFRLEKCTVSLQKKNPNDCRRQPSSFCDGNSSVAFVTCCIGSIVKICSKWGYECFFDRTSVEVNAYQET